MGIGFFFNVINNILLIGIGCYSMLWFLSLWSFIERKFIHFTEKRWQEVLLSFWIGLCTFLLLIQVLLQCNLLYGWVSVLLFIGLGILIRKEKSQLREDEKILEEEIISFKTNNDSIILSIILCIILMYLFLGFQNSFIPYSTAWDANHEYMYWPKVRAEYGWIFWWDWFKPDFPELWHCFITFFFSVFGWSWLPRDGLLFMSKSTIAVSMNFRSAILTLIFSFGIVSTVISFIKNNQKSDSNEELSSNTTKQNSWVCVSCKKTNTGKFCTRCWWKPDEKKTDPWMVWTIMGRCINLLWLTSWMGAFLVIVDNKSDLWIMAISTLALLSWMIFIQNLHKRQEKSQLIKYVILAGFLFACACLAKVTAFVDIVLFFIFLIGLEISSFTALGVWFIVAWVLRYLNILTSSIIISETLAKVFIVIGIIFTIAWFISAFQQKRKLKNIFFYGLILLGSFVIPFILFKYPSILYEQSLKHDFSLTSGFKSLLAANNTSDWYFYSSSLSSEKKDVKTCVQEGNIYSEEELQENLQEQKKTSGNDEDFGRYIWYWRKEFYSSRIYRFSCDEILERYWAEAWSLCMNADNVEQFDITTLKHTYKRFQNKDSKAAILLKDAIDVFDALDAFDSKSFNIIILNNSYNHFQNKDSKVALLLKDAIDAMNELDAVDALNPKNFNIETLKNDYNTFQNKDSKEALLLKDAIDAIDALDAVKPKYSSTSVKVDPSDFEDYIDSLRPFYEYVDINIIYPLVKLFFLNDGCYSFNQEAKQLCEISDAIEKFDIKTLKNTYNNFENKDSQWAILLKSAIDAFDSKYSSNSVRVNPLEFRDFIVSLRQFYQAYCIKSSENYLAIPYRLLVPVNITMNRSLQNLSSYYTDIGFIWIMCYILILVAFVYALVRKEKKLLVISLTTLIAWGIWWIVWSAILWYGTVLISWTMITISTWFYCFVTRNKNEIQQKNPIYLIFFFFLGLFIGIQFFLNLIRITSQGAFQDFSLYKGNVGEINYYNEKWELETRKKIWYNEEDIFNLQFSQYNSLLHYLQNRKDEDWVLIAGTYIQYFLKNQKNVVFDYMLADLWKELSDWDPCKSYRRLKNKNIKYFLIDPNIWSVWMGEWNESVFQRFFAKVNALDGSIEVDGILTELVRLYKRWYLKLFGTNNLGVYYSFTLTDEELKTFLGNLSDEDLILKRAKYMGIRYFSEVWDLYNEIFNIFVNRIINLEAVPDFMVLYSVEWDAQKIKSALINILGGNGNQVNLQQFNQWERSLIQNYLAIYTWLHNNSERHYEYIQRLLGTSLTSSSQVIGLELL